MTRLTSNTLACLAGRIRETAGKAKAASAEAAAAYIEAGRLLCQARAEVRHGEWAPFLEATGVHERQARRLTQLARSGLDPDTVSDLGGIKEALRLLSLLDAEGESPGIVRATLDRLAAEGADDMLAAFWQAMGHPEIAREGEARPHWPAMAGEREP